MNRNDDGFDVAILVEIFEATSRRMVKRIRIDTGLCLNDIVLAFAADSSSIAVSFGDWVNIYKLASIDDAPVRLNLCSSVWLLRFSPKTNALAVAYSENKVQIWDLDTGTHKKIVCTRASQIEFLPNGKEVSSLRHRCTEVQSWNVGDRLRVQGRCIICFETIHPDDTVFAFCPAQTLLARGHDGAFSLQQIGTQCKECGRSCKLDGKETAVE
jgi:WD40 repeat protein